MEEIEKLPEEYKEAFNTGYEFSKEYSDIGHSILDQNKEIPKMNIEGDLTKLAGLYAGMNEFYRSQNLEQEKYRLNELENLRGENLNDEIER
jgi:hypothetical protein